MLVSTQPQPPHTSSSPTPPFAEHHSSNSGSNSAMISTSSSPSRLCPADFLLTRPRTFAMVVNGGGEEVAVGVGVGVGREGEGSSVKMGRGKDKVMVDKSKKDDVTKGNADGPGSKSSHSRQHTINAGSSASGSNPPTTTQTQAPTQPPPSQPQSQSKSWSMLTNARALLDPSSSSTIKSTTTLTPPFPSTNTNTNIDTDADTGTGPRPSNNTIPPAGTTSHTSTPSPPTIGLGRAIEALRLVIRGLGIEVGEMRRMGGCDGDRQSGKTMMRGEVVERVNPYLSLITQIQSSHPLTMDASLIPISNESNKLNGRGLPPLASSSSAGDDRRMGRGTRGRENESAGGSSAVECGDYESLEGTCGGAIREVVGGLEGVLGSKWDAGDQDHGGEAGGNERERCLQVCRDILSRIPGKRTRSIKSPPPCAKDLNPLESTLTTTPSKDQDCRHDRPAKTSSPISTPSRSNPARPRTRTQTHSRQPTATSTRFGSPTSTLDPPTPFHHRLASRASSIFSTTSSLWSTRTGLSRVSKSSGCLPQLAEVGAVHGELGGSEGREAGNGKGKGKERASMSAAEAMLRRYQVGTMTTGSQSTRPKSRLSHGVVADEEMNGNSTSRRKDQLTSRSAKPAPKPIRLDSSHVESASRLIPPRAFIGPGPESPDIMSPAGRLTAITFSPVLPAVRPNPPPNQISTLSVPLSRSLHATASSPTLNASFKQRMQEQQLSQKNKPRAPRAFENDLVALGPMDPALAAAEAASSLTKHVDCGVCGKEGVNFPNCRKCGLTFCSRECRVGVKAAGDGKKHICGLNEARRLLKPPEGKSNAKSKPKHDRRPSVMSKGSSNGVVNIVGGNDQGVSTSMGNAKQGMERRASLHGVA